MNSAQTKWLDVIIYYSLLVFRSALGLHQPVQPRRLSLDIDRQRRNIPTQLDQARLGPAGLAHVAAPRVRDEHFARLRRFGVHCR